jgi:glycerol uptake facilitator-like aquaporin
MTGMSETLRRLAAEAFGTAFLVMAVVGSGIMAASATSDVALALLANTIATAAMLVVLITILGPVSGAHLNPAVSVVMALNRSLTPASLAGYVTAQVAGAFTGTMAAHAMFGRNLVELSETARSGSAQLLSEGIATFGLVFTILAGLRYARASVAQLVGLYISAAYWFTASTSFANPALTAARSLTNTFSGIRPIDVPAFMIAELAGALAALICCRWLLKSETESESAT